MPALLYLHSPKGPINYLAITLSHPPVAITLFQYLSLNVFDAHANVRIIFFPECGMQDFLFVARRHQTSYSCSHQGATSKEPSSSSNASEFNDLVTEHMISPLQLNGLNLYCDSPGLSTPPSALQHKLHSPNQEHVHKAFLCAGIFLSWGLNNFPKDRMQTGGAGDQTTDPLVSGCAL